jgi:hypothetical protein
VGRSAYERNLTTLYQNNCDLESAVADADPREMRKAARGGEATDTSTSAGVVGTGRWKGDAGHLGRPVRHGVAAPTPTRTAVLAGVGQGHGTAETG